MNAEHQRRICSKRQRYPDAGRARMAIQAQVDRGTVEPDRLRKYRCCACGGWHLYRNQEPARPQP